jgi:hypothetical protein
MKEENCFSKQLRISSLLTEAFTGFNILRFVCVPDPLSLPSTLVSVWSERVIITSNLKRKNYRSNKYLATLVIALISSPCRDLIFQNSQPLLITLQLLLSLFQPQNEFLSFSLLLRHTQSLDSTSFQKYIPIASSTSLVNGRS